MEIQVKAEPTTIERNAKCPYCQAKITTENELQERIEDRESEILNFKNQIQNLKFELNEKDTKL